MFNIIKGTFVGAIIGFICCLAVYVLSGILEILNCAWQIVSCQCDFGSVLPVWNGDVFAKIAMFGAIGGALIGIVYGIVQNIQERNLRDAADRERAARNDAEQRKKNAKELNKEISFIHRKAVEIQADLSRFDLNNPYYGSEIQSSAWKKLYNLEMLKVELYDIIDDYNLLG